MAAPTIPPTSTNDGAIKDGDPGAADGWGDDADLGVDHYGRPADAACRRCAGEAGSGDEQGGWDIRDDDLGLPADLRAAAHGGNDEEGVYYVAPTRRQFPKHTWAAHSQLAVDRWTIRNTFPPPSLLNWSRQLESFKL